MSQPVIVFSSSVRTAIGTYKGTLKEILNDSFTKLLIYSSDLSPPT